jgi:hypothetical protein
MKQWILLILVALFLLISPGVSAHALTSVCTDTGLSGPAQQENLLYCATNQITGITTDAASSTYKAAIDVAQAKHIIVGTPTSVSQTTDWVNTPITYVEFSSGFHAEHYNPSSGHVRIYDLYDRLVWEE